MHAGWLAELKTIIDAIARGVEFLAALLILAAAVEATAKSVMLFVRPNAPAQLKTAVRLQFARWLAMALEFELAADILSTAVTPTWTDIGKLAAVAALRTALNYFLEKEIEQESRPAQQMAERTTGAAARVSPAAGEENK